MKRIVRKAPVDGLETASLFAGVGGFDVAAEALGIPVVAWSEFDPSANRQVNQAVLSQRFPAAKGFGDVADVSYADLGRPRLITAGTPCQGFSVAGLREGMGDDRSVLFAEFVRIIREGIEDGNLKYAVWENVPGALNSNKGLDFANVLAAMVGWGAPMKLPKFGSRTSRWCGVAMGPLGSFAWRTIDAQNFGVAQRRERVFGVWSRNMDCATMLFGPKAIDLVLESEPDIEPAPGVGVWLFDDFDKMPFNSDKEPDEPVNVKLSAVLDWDVDEKYYLSETACKGILTRATRRGRELPAVLEYALRSQAGEEVGDPPEDDDGRFERGEVVSFDWQASGSGDTSFRGKSRAYVVRKGDAAGTLQNNKVEAVAIPILGVDPTWVTKAGGIGEDVIPAMRENSYKDPHFVVIPYRKSRRAHHDEDWETWEQDEFSNTLNPFDLGNDVRTCDVVVEVPLTEEVVAALSASGVGTCGADDNQAQAGHLIPVLGFNIDPESGQGADLKARPTDHAPALTANWLEKITDRGLRVVEVTTSYRVRRITPVECERLQGFPDGHTDINDAADSHRYRQMGNAVAVPCAAWVLARIKAVHEGRELPDLPEVLEKLPWLRSESSVVWIPMVIKNLDETSSVSSNGTSRSSKGNSSKKVVRRSGRSWASTPRSRTSD